MPTPKPVRLTRNKHVPLSYDRIAILTAVATGPIDRARVAQVVIGDTVGTVVIQKSTLYHHIQELTEKGYLQRSGALTLTAKGWRTLHGELARLVQQHRILKQRLRV